MVKTKESRKCTMTRAQLLQVIRLRSFVPYDPDDKRPVLCSCTFAEALANISCCAQSEGRCQECSLMVEGKVTNG